MFLNLRLNEMYHNHFVSFNYFLKIQYENIRNATVGFIIQLNESYKLHNYATFKISMKRCKKKDPLKS